MKRALVVIGIILLGIGLFYAGWSLRERKYTSEFNAAVGPAQEITDNLLDQKPAAAYDLLPSGYKSSVSKDQFKESVAAGVPKGSKQTGLSIYQGANESLVNFDVSDSTGKELGTLMVFTIKTGGKWQANYVQFNKK